MRKFVAYCKILLPFIICLLIGAVLGYLVRNSFIRPNLYKQQALFDQVQPLRLDSNDYKFINPLLGYKLPESTEFQEYQSLGTQVNSLVSAKIASGQAADIAVYFRDQIKGRWVGINEDHTFSPASLLKVPLMIAYYKIAEGQPGLLQEKITWDGKTDLNQTEIIKPEFGLEPNKAYTVAELVDRMIAYSDNNATKLLLGHIDHNTLEEVFTDLHVKLPANGQPGDYISDKSYALFFSVLYSSTYLTPAMSEHALQLLSKTTFKDGLVAGVPSGVTVSHKFGEYGMVGPSGGVESQELHDCGHVYYPGHAYILCVMTKGKSVDTLKGVIKDVSSLVYSEMRKEYK